MKTDKLSTYTHDLLTLNKHFRSVIRSQKDAESVSNTKALNLLHNIDVALTNQINDFERFEDLYEDSNLEKAKETIASMFGSVAGAIDKVRNDTVSKMLRDDYTALGMIASGYTMLNTAAITAEHDELANFSRESLQTIAQLITETSQVLPFIVADELTDNAEDALSVGEESLGQTQKAWKPEELFEEA